ncbi:hypothetical protein [Erythrobacter alti]|uniref:hypothetical protein n=1 Tax=Erythrobacter alti TaxID=1896145 RepID=UPI0030F4782C
MNYLLLAIALIVGIRGLLQPAGYLHAPTLIALIFAGWYAPQLIIISSDVFVPRDALFNLGLMSVFCVLASLIGWELAIRRQTVAALSNHTARQELSNSSLAVSVVALTIFAAAANVLLNQMRGDVADLTQWTGPIVIVNFFAQLRIPALAMSVMLVLRERNTFTISLMAVNMLICLPVAFLLLRRTEMIEIGVAVAGAAWFARRIRIPLPGIIAAIIAFSIVVYAISPLRATQKRLEYETGGTVSLLSPMLWRNIEVTNAVATGTGSAYDIRNATYIVQYIEDTGDHSYAGGLWNTFVRQYVPRQFVGDGVKRDLMVGSGRINIEYLASQYSFFYQTGTTPTGPGAAYRDFWYFGAFVFMLICYLLGTLYMKGLRRGFFWQTAYLSMLPFALTGVTHGYERLFVNLPLYAATIWGLYMLARWSNARHIQQHRRFANVTARQERLRRNRALKPGL